MFVLETERLILRRLSADDAAFILELLNDPAFLRNIGDKGVRTEEDAVKYIENGPTASYERFGFGLNAVELKSTGESIGICGLLKRDTLPDPDIGFAFLPAFRSKGYAVESALGIKNHGWNTLGLKRILAITTQDNTGSIRVLEKVGFGFERLVRLSEDEPELKLFAVDAEPS